MNTEQLPKLVGCLICNYETNEPNKINEFRANGCPNCKKETEINYCNACHLLAHEKITECPAYSSKIATLNGVLTLGEFRKITEHLDNDTQIVTTDPNYYLNVLGVELPDDEGTFAITLVTADTFDPRQF